MDLAEHIHKIRSAAPLDLDELARDFLRHAYKARQTPLRLTRTTRIPACASDEQFEQALMLSGLTPMCEHLYPTELSQAQ
jgi:hypothetical protein